MMESPSSQVMDMADTRLEDTELWENRRPQPQNAKKITKSKKIFAHFFITFPQKELFRTILPGIFPNIRVKNRKNRQKIDQNENFLLFFSVMV